MSLGKSRRLLSAQKYHRQGKKKSLSESLHYPKQMAPVLRIQLTLTSRRISMMYFVQVNITRYRYTFVALLYFSVCTRPDLPFSVRAQRAKNIAP